MILYDQNAYRTISFNFLYSTLIALVLFLCVHLGVHLPIIFMITISFCKLNTNISLWYASRINRIEIVTLGWCLSKISCILKLIFALQLDAVWYFCDCFEKLPYLSLLMKRCQYCDEPAARYTLDNVVIWKKRAVYYSLRSPKLINLGM